MTNPEGNSALSAALKGATLAFNGQKTDTDKPKLKPKPTPRTPNPKAADNGAIQAASQASRDHSCASGPRSPSSPSVRRNNPLSRQTTGGSVRDLGSPSYGFGRELEHGAVSKKLSQYLGSSPLGPQYLSPPGARPSPDNRSASFIAATLAASRSGSASPSPHHTGHGYTPQPAHSPLNPTLGRNRGVGMSSANSSAVSLDLPDTTSIPPTNSLISMFEKQTEDTDPVKTPVKNRLSSPAQARLGTTPKLRSPTPPRSLSPRERALPRGQVNSEGREGKGASSGPNPTFKPVPPERARTPPPQIIRRAATEILSPEPKRLGPKPNLQPPAVRPKAAAGSSNAAVKPKQSPRPPLQKPQISSSSASGSQVHAVQSKLERAKIGGSVMGRRASIGSNSSNDTFVSASSTRSPRSRSPARELTGPAASAEELPRRPSLKPAPAPPKPRTLRKASSMNSVKPHQPPRRPGPTTTSSNSSSQLPLDSLTSAIMASNLATTRHVSSPAPPPPLPAPRRPGNTNHHKHLHLHPHHHNTTKKHHTGGSTSPQRTGNTTTLLTTLRRPRSASDDEDLRTHHRRHGKHPLRGGNKKHAHHEGARKRWRDEVSPRERKRYEAVWASNRGLFYSDPESPELVVNIVVRDIWSRSRLPFDELAEVWDLVYRGRDMGLNREEFVVGMWLIDQRLRGRKIPARVGDSVWDSTRGMRVKVPKGKGKK